jgi:hypothetical protein
MNIKIYENALMDTVIEPMIDLMTDFEDCGFDKDDIAKCESLVKTYLSGLCAITEPTNEAILDEVKTLVLALNELNEATDYSLIETEEREALWSIIQQSAIDCGLVDPEDDITEEWREW